MQLLPFYYVYYLPAMLCMNRGIEKIPQAIIVLVVWNCGMIFVIGRIYEVLRKEYEGVGA
jgi:ABC-type uncharacterized transport system permease subunit